MRRILAFLPLALAAALPAQTQKVVPTLFTNLEGPSSILYPFSYETCRTQVLYRSGAMAKAGGVVTGVAFRREGQSFPTATFNARNWSVQVDAWITPAAPASMSTTFANNRGAAAPVTVFTGTLNLPALVPNTTIPAPFAANVPFQPPLPFVVSTGNVLLEFIGLGPGTTLDRYYLDSEYATNQAGARTSVIGMYCVGLGQETFKIYEDPKTWVLGGLGQISWKVGNGNITSIVNWIGDRADRWGPVPLPFDLTPLGGLSSTPDKCMIFTNWLAAQVVLPAGIAQWGPLPNDPVLENATIFTQALTAVSGANPLGIVMGPAISITIGSANPPVGDLQTVYKTNDLAATTGTFLTNTGYYCGPVTQFQGVFN